jgi:hypothetical protein
VSKPILTVRLSVEFEVEYDPFTGRTPEQFADIIDDDLHRALNDFREDDVKGIFSKVESVEQINLFE